MTVRPRGPLPDWKPRTARQQGILADVVARYGQHDADGTLPRGGRGIFYDLRPDGLGNGVTYRKPDSEHPASGFGPMEAHPAAVQEVLALARRAGIVPEEWVADERASAAHVPFYDDSADGVVDGIARHIDQATVELDPQTGQPVYIEVLCEAGDLGPRLARIAQDHGVPVYTSSGFDGLKGKRAMAERALNRDEPTVVLHVGDRDPHGNAIYVAAAEDAVAWADGQGDVVDVETPGLVGLLPDLRDDLDGTGPGLTFVRLALTTAQAVQLNLLDADGKAEVDGVPVLVMDGWLIDAILALQVRARREVLLAEERGERERLPATIRRRLRSLLEDEP